MINYITHFNNFTYIGKLRIVLAAMSNLLVILALNLRITSRLLVKHNSNIQVLTLFP